eukprot:435961-Prymnesium_polylepis.1
MHGGTICDGRHGEPLSGDCRARFVTPERTESEKRHSRPRVARVVKGSMPQAHAPLHGVCAARVAAPPPSSPFSQATLFAAPFVAGVEPARATGQSARASGRRRQTCCGCK